MAIALLDINDSNLQLWHGNTHLQSPGYALLVDQQYRFGNAARAAARLQPRDINTRYWWQLSTETLQPALGPARHTGDLVHAQLQELHREGGQPQEMLMAVSGSMQRDQLALLLGIVQQCPFAAVGLVHRSVALGSLHGAAGRLFHLEIQLHQAVISELTQRDGKVELLRSLPLPGAGLLQLQEKLVEIIATAFIRQTRFDPRRKAITEQQLYDALPDALRALSRDSETNIEVSGYRAGINRGELQGAGQRLFSSAREAIGVSQAGDRVIADPVAGLLPGLAAHLPGFEVLAADSVRTALEQPPRATGTAGAGPELRHRPARAGRCGGKAGACCHHPRRPAAPGRHPPAAGAPRPAAGGGRKQPGPGLEPGAHRGGLAPARHRRQCSGQWLRPRGRPAAGRRRHHSHRP